MKKKFSGEKGKGKLSFLTTLLIYIYCFFFFILGKREAPIFLFLVYLFQGKSNRMIWVEVRKRHNEPFNIDQITIFYPRFDDIFFYPRFDDITLYPLYLRNSIFRPFVKFVNKDQKKVPQINYMLPP